MKHLLLFKLTFFLMLSFFAQMPQKLEENRFLKRNNNKFGVTDSTNKIIVPFIYNRIEYKNNRLIVEKQSKQGLITLNNEKVTTNKYRYILPRENNRFLLLTDSSRYGLCDSVGRILIPTKYKHISPTEMDEFYISENDEKLNGVFDFNGNVIFPEIYKFYTIDKYKIFAKCGTQAFILNLKNLSDSIKLDDKIDLIETQRHYSSTEKFFQIIKKSNKYGLINSDNKIMIPVIYDELTSSQHWRYFLIKQNNKLGLINVDGKIIKELIYDDIFLRKEYIILKRKNQKNEYYSYEW